MYIIKYLAPDKSILHKNEKLQITYPFQILQFLHQSAQEK